MRHDGVYEKDAGLVYTGTPKEVLKWLEDHPSAERRAIYVGEMAKPLSVPDYLEHARYEAVLAQVKIAMERQKDVTGRGRLYIDEEFAQRTAHRITEIF